MSDDPRTDPMKIVYTTTDLGRRYGFRHSYIWQEYRMGRYVQPDLHTPGGRPLWSERLVLNFEANNPRWGNIVKKA